ncbi:sortase [Isoptericola sp. b515]|uniref:class F sortase n=1 Tax=Isoptericola sp. b515 TaxID=3064652 RepID=UPI002713644C|nr:class F sortase [Isoptericola sp. b515]MDO8148727.1 sortase [Isoptericola sp. b515]
MTRTHRSAAGRVTRPVRRVALATVAAVSVSILAGVLMVVADDTPTVGADVPRVEAAEATSAPEAPASPSASADPTPGGAGDQEGAGGPAVPDIPVVSADLAGSEPAAPPELVTVQGLLETPVRPVGVDPDGTMELPESGDVAGWYRFGPAPGDPQGAAVLASHVDTQEGVGQFARLAEATAGDKVTVTDADGVRHRYEVTEITRYSKEAVPWEKFFDRSGERRLVLVTCGGRWDAEAGHYEDNLVVTAVAT